MFYRPRNVCIIQMFKVDSSVSDILEQMKLMKYTNETIEWRLSFKFPFDFVVVSIRFAFCMQRTEKRNYRSRVRWRHTQTKQTEIKSLFTTGPTDIQLNECTKSSSAASIKLTECWANSNHRIRFVHRHTSHANTRIT